MIDVIKGDKSRAFMGVAGWDGQEGRGRERDRGKWRAACAWWVRKTKAEENNQIGKIGTQFVDEDRVREKKVDIRIT